MRIINGFLVEKAPDALELRAFLCQFIGITDKRNFISISLEIQEHIDSKYSYDNDIFEFILNKCPEQDITAILEQFEILPKILYYFLTDKDSYTNYFFDNRPTDVPNTIKDNEIECDDLDEQEYYEGNNDEIEPLHPIDFPRLYGKVAAKTSGFCELIIMELIPNEWYEIYNGNGVNITYLFWELYEMKSLDSEKHLECNRFNDVKIGADNSLLLSTGGRFNNWLLYKLSPDGIVLLKWDVDFGGSFEIEPNNFIEMNNENDILDFLTK